MSLYAVASNLVIEDEFGDNRVDSDFFHLMTPFSEDKFFILDKLFECVKTFFSRKDGKFSPESVNLWVFMEDIESLVKHKLDKLTGSLGCKVVRLTDDPNSTILEVRLPKDAMLSTCKEALDICNPKLVYIFETELYNSPDEYSEDEKDILKHSAMARVNNTLTDILDFKVTEEDIHIHRDWMKEASAALGLIGRYGVSWQTLRDKWSSYMINFMLPIFDRHKGVLFDLSWTQVNTVFEDPINNIYHSSFVIKTYDLFKTKNNEAIWDRLKIISFIDAQKQGIIFTEKDREKWRHWKHIHSTVTAVYSSPSQDYLFDQNYDFQLAFDLHAIRTLFLLTPTHLLHDLFGDQVRVDFSPGLKNFTNRPLNPGEN